MNINEKQKDKSSCNTFKLDNLLDNKMATKSSYISYEDVKSHIRIRVKKRLGQWSIDLCSIGLLL